MLPTSCIQQETAGARMRALHDTCWASLASVSWWTGMTMAQQLLPEAHQTMNYELSVDVLPQGFRV